MNRRVNDGTTHWEGCESEHHDCALAKIAALKDQLVRWGYVENPQEQLRLLRAELAALKEECDDGRCPSAQHERIVRLKAEAELAAMKAWHKPYEALLVEQDRLREALEKYGKHPDSCPRGVGIGIYKPPADARCDCGIGTALAESVTGGAAERGKR